MNTTEALNRVHEITQGMKLKAKHHIFIAQVVQAVAKELEELDALRKEKKGTDDEA